jgi:hypothetical protein
MDRNHRAALIGAFALIVGVLVGVFGTRLSEYEGINWPTDIKAVSDGATVIAVAIAGIWTWYLARRRRSLVPRATIVHRTQLWQRGAESYLRLYVELQNPGEVAISPGDGNTQIQLPPDGVVDQKLYVDRNCKDHLRLRHCCGFEDVTIEPKESEIFPHDVPVPEGCRFVQIRTELACMRRLETKRTSGTSKRPQEDYDITDEKERWTLTTLLDLHDH